MSPEGFMRCLNEKYPNNVFPKTILSEIVKDLGDKTLVEHPLTKSEKNAILEKLNNIRTLKGEQKFVKCQSAEFRLDNALKKGSGHWEIQRNGEKGKTTVAQVHAPDWAQELLNTLSNDTLQNKYDKVICNKLIQSLNSGSKEITKAYVTIDDLKNVFL